MPTSVLLSIKPEFAAKIFSGVKRFEFRRSLFKSESVSRVVVYASSPIQMVVGEFAVGGILKLRKNELWNRTKRHSGIQKFYFDEYFEGLTVGFAIEIQAPRVYRTPLCLSHVCDSVHPPQSFMYLREGSMDRCCFSVGKEG